MNTIEIQFKYSNVLYSATAEFLLQKQRMIRVYGFYPYLPAHRKEVYFIYNPEQKKMEASFFPDDQKGIVKRIYASIYECCYDSGVLLDNYFGNKKPAILETI